MYYSNCCLLETLHFLSHFTIPCVKEFLILSQQRFLRSLIPDNRKKGVLSVLSLSTCARNPKDFSPAFQAASCLIHTHCGKTGKQ